MSTRAAFFVDITLQRVDKWHVVKHDRSLLSKLGR